MYCSHYGFSERPFDVTPDPKLLYLGSVHREVLSTLLYGINERRGFIVVFGEAGTGKTTVLRSAMEQLDEKVKVAGIYSPDVTFDEFLYLVLIELELAKEDEKLEKVTAIQRLNEFAIDQLSQGGNVVIMVDEAQIMNHRCMENLRLLSNLETSKTKLLQIILAGQPELEDKLMRYDLRQLTQRINLRRQLLPFNKQETYACMEHRLKAVGYEGPMLFSDDAKRLIWNYSKGIPRLINTVCDNALLTGYALKSYRIDKSTVLEVIEDLTCVPIGEKSTNHEDTTPNPISYIKSLTKGKFLQSLKVRLAIALLIFLTGVNLLAWPHRPIEKCPSVAQNPIPSVASPDPIRAEDPPEPIQASSQTDSTQTAVTQAPIQTVAKSDPNETTDSYHVIVKGGESLSSIIIEVFGKYDELIEQDILRANPSIKNPNRLFAGQTIILPLTTYAQDK